MFRKFLISRSGTAAAEFALVLPIMVLLILGTIGVSTMMYANAGLNFAAQDAARCMAIKTTVCPGVSVQTYGASKYVGPTLASLTFTGSAPACGRRVVATGTYTLKTGLATISVPMSATACYAA